MESYSPRIVYVIIIITYFVWLIVTVCQVCNNYLYITVVVEKYNDGKSELTKEFKEYFSIVYINILMIENQS